MQRKLKLALLTLALIFAGLCLAHAAASTTPGRTPQAIRLRRAALYLESARQPLAKLASQIYEFAADSEFCRLDSGAKACGLPADPLKSTDLKQIFNYYVKLPVNSEMEQQKVAAQKGHWIWQAAPNTRQ